MLRRLTALMVPLLVVAGCGGRKRQQAAVDPAPASPPPADDLAQSLPMARTAQASATVFGAIKDIVDQGRSEADGRICESDTVAYGCTLVYRTSCHRPGAPEGLAFWYQLTLPLGQLDSDKLRAGLGLSDHPGHHAVELATQGEVMSIVTDSGDKSTAAGSFFAIGADPEAATRAERLVALLKQAASACR